MAETNTEGNVATSKTGDWITSVEAQAGEIFDRMEKEKANRPPPESAVDRAQAEASAAAAKAAETKTTTAPPPEDEVTLPDGTKMEMPGEIKSDKGKASWKFYKAQVREWKEKADARIAELESKVNAAPASVDTSKWETQIAQLQKERDEFREKVGQLDFAATPEFQKHYVQAHADVMAEAVAAVGGEHGARLQGILLMPKGAERQKQLEALFEDVSDFAKATIVSTVRDLDKIDKEKGEYIANWKEQAKLREKAYGERAEKAKAEEMKMFDAELRSMRDKNPALQLREKDDAWNAQVKEAEDTARQLFSAASSDQRAKASLWAVVAPRLAEQLKGVLTENESLKAEMAKLKTAAPRLDGKGGSDLPEARKSSGNFAADVAEMAAAAGFVK